MTQPLAGIRIVEFAQQIAGPYCGKLFVDAGAEVVKVEPPEGDSLRRGSAERTGQRGGDSALFRYLNAGKQSVLGGPGDAHVAALLAGADLVIEAHGLAGDGAVRLDAAALRAAHPALVVLSITPYGLVSPWSGRPATEFTLQAECGSLGMRAVMGQEPYQAGGRIGEWAAGVYGAAAALPAVFAARASGRGEAIDLSILEVANFVYSNFSETMNRLMNGSPGDPQHAFLAPVVETPSIEPTADGYVGFCTNSRQQFSDFLLMIERTDLQGDAVLAQFAGRLARFAEWEAIVHAWTKTKTTAEIVEFASLLRIPVAPIGNGKSVLEHEQLAARGVFVPAAGGDFLQPRRSYRLDDADPPLPREAPALGEHTQTARFAPRPGAADPLAAAGRGALSDAPTAEAERLLHSDSPGASTSARYGTSSSHPAALPLAGLRILDLGAWWAGPSVSQLFGSLGADVIHVESTRRPDGLRMVGGMMAAHYSAWWEACPHFLHANSNKRGITLDLAHPKGFALLERLIPHCDALLENFTPRVLDNFGLDWQRVRALNPRMLMLRMPAFGLTGPWRDHTGFAQTMEQLSGLAWVTGHASDQPRIPRGPCDPVAGMHAAFAVLVALAERARTGRGLHVESTMVESALNIAAEQVVEWSACGRLLEREGNRSPLAAPQGLYPCAGGTPGAEQWLALSVTSDAQWSALRRVLGDPGWARSESLATLSGRRAAHDAIDAELRAWTRTRERGELAAKLRAAGIPAAEVANACRLLQSVPPFAARGWFEAPEHPVVGAMPLPSLPFRYAGVERWLQRPAPTLGQHNEAVLGGLLGLSDAELRALESEGVIGTKLQGL